MPQDFSNFLRVVSLNVLFSFLDIEEKTYPNLCTYVNTGNSFLVQEYFRCITCGLDEKKRKGACKICIKTCHAGHDVRFAKNDRFFCDCGAEGEKSCRSLLKKQSSKYFYPYFNIFILIFGAILLAQ